ncbi:hypothetical protein JCM21714_4072 [Gracilibacillus boraciitolerans JCM 21714]|uniref:DUF4025 domain-containing protein n=1 Tax=Gracilibacillus boraciitolerans JCM 21714 TaxID=1298598 RepID=W4VPV8_9BACI|nr:YozQ family protein [Gracilibacillus boraciitolerans]GAE94873.1 hypothetical protein JCM21714_4072 [Gracilibacillus boraciitolerans JCM 21714]
MKQKKPMKKDSQKVAEQNYQIEDYQRQNQFSQGLAETHEQATDTLKEGYNEKLSE